MVDEYRDLYSDWSGTTVRFTGQPSGNNGTTLKLNGHRLTVGGGGIISNRHGFYIKGPGVITSSTGTVKIRFTSEVKAIPVINAVISDNWSRKVGFDISGTGAGVALLGSDSNTFTGTVKVDDSLLWLAKENGATAISGDINIINGGKIRIDRSNQIADRSTVKLESRNLKETSVIFIGSADTSGVTEKIGRLVVDYSGIIDFDLGDKSWHGQRYFYIDDLIINPDSYLQIDGWRESDSHLLVRKDSTHLKNALGKMGFRGYDRNNIHLEDFSRDYWEISATPEPATYGAALGALGLAFWLHRARRRSRGLPRLPRR